MKKLLSTAFLFLGILIWSQEFGLSTLKMGELSLNSTLDEFKKASNFQPKENDENRVISYKGEPIKLEYSYYYNEDKGNYDFNLWSMTTSSKAFKTKSGMGVGNTKEELLQAYKNFPNFTVGQRWDENKEAYTSERTYFSLEDVEAFTILTFYLENNIVTEVSVFINDGC